MNIRLNCTTQAIEYNNVGIIYDPMCMYAVLMIEEYYTGKEYDGTIFLLTPCNGFDFNISNPLTLEIIKNIFYNIDIKRIIFLNFDHLTNEIYVNALNEYLKSIDVDEIWEWQYENVISKKYLLQDRVKFMPLRYVSRYEKFKILEYKEQEYVCHFIGNIDMQRRRDFFTEMGYNYLNFKIICGNSICSRIKELNTSGFSLNIHGMKDNLREQLRISENICLGIPVMTEQDTHLYHEGLVAFYNYDEAINNVREFFDRMKSLYDLYRMMDISELYKKLTQQTDAYENYKNNIIATY